MNPMPSKMNLGAKIFQTMRCRRRSAADSIEANNRMPFVTKKWLLILYNWS